MVNTINFGKGTAVDEQDLILNLANFAVGICGWELVDVIASTAADVDYVFKSSGTEPGRFQDLYMRWRGNANLITVHMYTRYQSVSDNDGYVYDVDYGSANCADSDFNWWGFGDADGLWLVWESGGYYYSAYTGYMETYYADSVYPQCACCIGQRYQTRWFDENRLLGYHPLYDRGGVLTSGTGIPFYAHKDIYNFYLVYHDPSDRDGTDQGHWPIIIRRTSEEGRAVIGELRHCLWFPGNTLSSGDWYTISGTNYKYFIQKYTADNSEVTGFGPILVSSGTEW